MKRKHRRKNRGSRRGPGKGSAFERKTCVHLSRWLKPNSDETLFWRTSQSGGRATTQHKKGIKNTLQAGDITAIHPKGKWFTDKFLVECKFHKGLDIQASLLQGKGRLAKFWRKLCKQARKLDPAKHPILIARENRTPTLVLFSERSHHAFVGFGYAAPLLVWSEAIGKTAAIVCFFEDVFKPERD